MKNLILLILSLISLSSWAKAPKLPMPADVAEEVTELFKISKFNANDEARVRLLLDEYVLATTFKEVTIRRIGVYLGVKTLPCFDKLPAKVRTESLNKLISSYSTIPLKIILAMKALGKGIDVVADSVTNHPSMANLKDVTPRGWPVGKTWSTVPGVGANNQHPTVIAGNSLTKGHAAIDLVLHEVGHGIDYCLVRKTMGKISQTRSFLDLSARTPYEKLFGTGSSYFRNVEENFGELFAMYHKDYMSRDRLSKTFPEAIEYFERLFSNYY